MTDTPAPTSRRRTGAARTPPRRNAETLAKGQREISVSEFFAKNRHLLGFDNPRKALLTTIKEAVDNALDACEEAGILPQLFIGIEQLGETRFRVTVRDNGPGIVKHQVANIFGKLLYGSKFHRLKMSRGQQGIGIAAAGMYALMTTGKPMVIHTKPHPSRPSHCITLAIDTQKNRADISDEEERHDFPSDTGTEVVLELEAKYNRGRQSVDEYLEQTAIANPHARLIYQPPSAGRSNGKGEGDDSVVPDAAVAAGLIDDYQHAERLAAEASATTTTPGGLVIYPRTVDHLPDEPKEIKPHPNGVELGTLQTMLKTTDAKQLGAFLQQAFSRVSLTKSNEVCDLANKLLGGDGTVTNRSWVSTLGHREAEAIYRAMAETKFMAPPTDCLSPIGVRQILAGLLKGVKADFYTATTRDPAVYRGNPFQIEVGLAYGGSLGGEDLARVIRFANRVPLLYQQSACCAYKAVLETSWKNYGLSQSRGALPQGPLVVMVHMASVWVPFTSESKEAIADYDEIRKEIKLAISECGRKLNTYVRRRARIKREGERRGVFERYIGEVVTAMNTIDKSLKKTELKTQFEEVARLITFDADTQFDDDGNPIKKDGNGNGNGNGSLDRDEATVIVEDGQPPALTDGKAGKSTTARKVRKTRADDDSQYDLYE